MSNFYRYLKDQQPAVVVYKSGIETICKSLHSMFLDGTVNIEKDRKTSYIPLGVV